MTSRARIALRAALGLVAATVGLGFSAKRAEAYPQWQFSSGTARCTSCHYSPAGGGLINGYGRDKAGEELSTFEGNGEFMHGAVELPKSLALGFDGRYAAMIHDIGEKRGPRQVHFPMQADLSARLALGEAFSLYATVGYRGQARVGDEPVGAGGAQPAGGSLFISREHYLMWRPSSQGAYVRAGRFFAPFGLRLAEHYAYVRRDLGFNLLEESYAVSGGWISADWELHLTGFGPDFVRQIGGDESGGAAMFELRTGDNTALGLQGRAGIKSDRTRYIGGLFGKTYIEGLKALLMTELNLVHSVFAGGKTTTQSFVGFAGVTFFPARGLWFMPFVERSQTSIAVRQSATNAAGVQVNWFPYPHFELSFLGRAQVPEAAGNSTTSTTAMTALVFLHYYM